MEAIEKDHFIVTGISHKTAPIEIREHFTISDEILPAVLGRIRSIEGIEECVVLSTCNRTELYARISCPIEEVRDRISRFILKSSGEKRNFLDYFYTKVGTDAFEHLFLVTCGLDSMILGETQIFGQVKNAYAVACDAKCTGPATNRLFHHAFQVGKTIRNTTSIGEGTVSVSSAAVKLARELFGSLSRRSILLIGSGEIGKLCAKHLYDSGIEHLYITNRTPERASALAQELSGVVVPFSAFEDMFDSVDIIIASVTSTSPIITTDSFEGHIGRRGGNPLFLIDLGVPRNIEAAAAGLESVHLYNIDDLEDVTFDNQDRRKTEAEKARCIIEKEVREYCSWLREREVIPAIQNLHDKIESIRRRELDRIKNTVSSKTYETVELVTRRIIRKILHNPTVTIRASQSGENRERLLTSIRELFFDDDIN